VDIVVVKADVPGAQDRTYLTRDGGAERVPVHPVHDLPHLVVESLFELRDGLWAELAQGGHPEASTAVTARDTKRQKLGRIVSGAASGAPTEAWLSEGHRTAKVATNAVANRWGDGPDTSAGVRRRLSETPGAAITQLLARLDDETIELAVRGVRDLDRRWAATPPGGTLRLEWPLPKSFFTAL
jgi:hypothetical protein